MGLGSCLGGLFWKHARDLKAQLSKNYKTRSLANWYVKRTYENRLKITYVKILLNLSLLQVDQ